MNALPRRLVIDFVIAATLLAGSGVWATRFWNAWTAGGGQPFFYQNYFEPAVMVACGKGFVVIESAKPAALTDFLNRRRDSMTCADLPAGIRVGRDGLFQGAWIYLQTTVGIAWRVLGISWSRMAPLFGLLFGIVVALVYGIGRLGMGRAAAIACALGIATSATHLVNLPHLRDYAKAPFTLALVLILGLLVTRPVRRGALLSLAVAYGVVLGIGYGFRTDFLIAVPVFPIAVLLFLEGGVARHLALKAAAAIVCLAVFAIVSWPVTSAVSEQGGCQWHVALLGVQSTFDESLGVAPAPYEFGYAYSDEYVIQQVQGFARRTHPGQPAPTYCSQDYDVQSSRYLRTIAASFPADLIARAYGSVLQIAELPFVASKSSLNGWALRFYEMRSDWLQPKTGWGIWIIAAALLIAAGVNLRIGIFLLFFVGYFGGYPAVQFQERHHFHLEFMTWWAAGFVAHHAFVKAWAARNSGPAWALLMRGALRSAAFALSAIALMVAVLSVARWYQRCQAAALFSSYLSAPKIALDLPEGAIRDVAPRDWPQALEVDLDQARCGPRPAVTFRYAQTAEGDLSRTVTVARRSSAPGITRILQPVLASYRRLELSDPRPGCVTGVYRIDGLQTSPLLLGATLPPDWPSVPLYQRMRDLESDPSLPALVALRGSPWTTASGTHVSVNRFGTLHVLGDRTMSGYQLTSPPVSVAAGAQVLLHANLTVWHGRVCLGVMDATTTRWLVPPTSLRAYVSFTADDSGAFMAAVVNCRATTAWLPSLFSVSSTSYAIE